MRGAQVAALWGTVALLAGCGDNNNVGMINVTVPDGGGGTGGGAAGRDGGSPGGRGGAGAGGQAGGTVFDAGASDASACISCDDGDPCTMDICNPASLQCTHVALTGQACDDGDACTTDDKCTTTTTAVVCQGTPRTCTAADACHVAGTCDRATGVCSNPAAADGAACSDGNSCTSGDTCHAGACQGGAAIVCTATDACHSAGVCDPATGLCSNTPVANGTSCADNNACNGAETCQAGVCSPGSALNCQSTNPCQVGSCNAASGCVLANVADGTSCTLASLCGAGTCQAGACTSAGGSCDDGNPCTTDTCGADGQCAHATAANGTSCSNGNACDGAETCQAGVCAPGTPVTCAASDQCHGVGTCNPATGACSNPALADNTPCSDGSACTGGDTCQAGSCRGGAATVCTASDQCHVAGICAPATGACSNPAAPDGTTCSDGNTCTGSDRCTGGVCGGTAVVCTASDQCHTTGTCDPGTGLCANPPAANGIACNDGSACTSADSCQAGVCTGTPAVCTASDQCHVVGTCNPATGSCSNPAAADGTACNDSNACTTADVCTGGSCGGAAKTCSFGSCDPATGTCPAAPCPTEVWSQQITSPLTGGVNAINIDGAGNLYVTGGFGDTIDLGSGPISSAGSADAYVARLNPATGLATWSKRFGDAADQSGAGVTEDGAGHVVAIGSYTGSVAAGGSAPPINATFDAAFIVGLDAATGAGLWARSINLSGGMGGGSLFALATDPTDHGVVVVGATAPAGASADFGAGPLVNAACDPSTTTCGSDVVVAKLDGATGALKWARQVGGPLNQAAVAVAVDAGGNVFVLGRYAGALDFGNSGLDTLAAANNEMFLVKLNGATGAGIAGRQFGTRGAQSPGGVAVDAAGNVVIAGGFVGTVNFGTAAAPASLVSAGLSDVFAAKLDNTLATTIWARQFGGADAQAAQAVGIDGAGDVVLGGLFSTALDLGAAGAFTSAGNADAFVAKLDGATGAAACARAAGDSSVQATSSVAVNRTTSEQFLLGNFLSVINWGVTNLVGDQTAGQTFIVRLKSPGSVGSGPATSAVQTILNVRCTGCHSGGSPPQGLDWTNVRAQIGVAAGECTNKLRIASGNAAASYTVDKLLGAAQDGGCFAGGRMPAGGAPALSRADIATITSWINAGTP